MSVVFVSNNKLANSARRGGGEPAPTITGGHDSGNRMWIDESGDEVSKEPVRVTVQEAATLQSYPEDFEWKGAKTKQYLQVGNAVPPLLAQRVLEALWAPAPDISSVTELAGYRNIDNGMEKAA